KAGLDKQYNDLIADADKKFAASDWTNAKSQYQAASNLKTAEQYPKDQMKKCDDNLAKADLDKKYGDFIADADKKFAASDWAGAKTAYQSASNLKASEQYPKDQIKICDDNIAKAGLDKQYNDLIADADKKFAASDWANAKSQYQAASNLKASEQYPKDQVKLCDDNIAKAGLDKQYNDLVKQADTKFKANDFAGAKTLYQQASDLKTSEQYPKDQIKLCDDGIAKAGVDKQYNDLVKQADDKFKAADWSGAKDLYSRASGVKSSEQYPKDQMKKCDDNIAKAGVDKQYSDLIADADKKFAAADWANAKTQYLAASDLKKAEQYPKDQVKKCDDNIAKAGLDKQYSDLIADADGKFGASDWAGAKAQYQAASALKAAEQYPKDQMKKCDDNIAKQGKDKKYNDLITSADEKFKAKDWAGAKSIYQQASAVKTDEQYPKDQVKACDDAVQKEKDAAYNAIVAKADSLFGKSDWAGAKAIYQQASTSRPAETYPKDQMKKCDENIAKEGKDKKYNDLITSADEKFKAADWAGAKTIYLQATAVKADEQYPKDQAKLCDDNIAKAGTDKKYNDAIAAADQKFGAGDWSGAKAKYQDALAIKPGEQYPSDQVKKCDDNSAADLEKKYTDAIKDADAKFGTQDFSGAKVLYQQASTLKPGEQYPKDQIKLCDDGLSKQGVDKKYNDLIAQADTKFKASDWAGAKTLYLQASAVKDGEQYPKDQAKLCDQKIQDAGLDKQYNDLVKQADAKFKLSDWAGAKAIYQQASDLKTSEQYPKDQVKLCDDNIAKAGDKKYNDAVAAADAKFKASDWAGAKAGYNTALGMKPGEQYPQDQIKLCDDNIAKAGTDKQYNAAIADADAKFKLKDWNGAKAKYNDALAIKGDEQYPKDQIKLCDDELNKLLGQDQAYKLAVAKGDSAFAMNDYETAQTAYTNAKNLKPKEAYPPAQLAKIAGLIADMQKDKSYHDLLAKGDSLFNAKDYDGAKKIYTTATTQKPSDQYPKDKLAEIKRIQDDIAFEQKKDAKYNKLIADADKKFKAGDWKGARDLYSQALLEKSEKYPRDQIAACDKKLNPPPANTKDSVKVQTHDEYVNDLVTKYPQGVTKMENQDGGTTTYTTIVVIGNQAWVYTKKVYSYGTYYFKDGEQISEATFNYDTNPSYVDKRLNDLNNNQK
ncbi:MAG TPA: hypothetical protein VFU15_01875, partial [Bacteroidia bacterium]|nr:hypothetical protein [Bacteroidia bacterium]